MFLGFVVENYKSKAGSDIASRNAHQLNGDGPR